MVIAKKYLFILTLVLMGCNSNQQIPNGKYVSGNESVVIKSKKILFNIRLENAPKNSLWKKQLNYSLGPKGEIDIYTMTSSEYSKTLIHFKWEWDGKNIVKVIKSSNKRVVFRPASPATSESAPDKKQ